MIPTTIIIIEKIVLKYNWDNKKSVQNLGFSLYIV